MFLRIILIWADTYLKYFLSCEDLIMLKSSTKNRAKSTKPKKFFYIYIFLGLCLFGHLVVILTKKLYTDFDNTDLQQ